MTHRVKQVAGLVLGGLMVAGAAVAATTHPSLPPIAPVREPVVTVQTYTGKLKSVNDAGASITITVTSPKKSAGDKVMTVNADTIYYLRNGVVTTLGNLQAGDEIKVWYLKHLPNAALKVWDRKEWSSTLTRTISDIAYTPEQAAATGVTFTLTKVRASTLYDVVAGPGTVVEKVVTGGTEAKTLSDLANAQVVKVTGLWNDAMKKLIASKIVIQ